MKIRPFAVVAGVIILLAAAIFAFWTIAERYKNAAPVFEVGIETYKDKYVTGEPFLGGSYKFHYFGPKFFGVVVYREKKEGVLKDGLPEEAIFVSTGLIETGDLSWKLRRFSHSLSAFSFTPDSGYVGEKRYFTEAGTYFYNIAVYRCADLSFGEECGSLPEKYEIAMFEGITPLASASKSIPVDFSMEYAVAEAFLNSDKQTGEAVAESVLTCEGEEKCLSRFVDEFEDRLKACERSEGTFGTPDEIKFGLYRAYEIMGSETGECEVKYKFLNGPQDFIDKEMVCTYSKADAEIISVAELKNCSGDLYNLIYPYFGKNE